MNITTERVLAAFNESVEWYRVNHPSLPHAAVVRYATAIVGENARKHVEELLNKYNEGVLSSITNK